MIFYKLFKTLVSRIARYASQAEQEVTFAQGYGIFNHLESNDSTGSEYTSNLEAQSSYDDLYDDLQNINNRIVKKRSKFTMREKPKILNEISKSNVYLKRMTIMAKLEQDNFVNDRLLQGWAYNFVISNHEAKLFSLLLQLCSYKRRKVVKLMSLLIAVVKHMEDKYVRIIQNINVRLNIIHWTLDNEEYVCDKQIYSKPQLQAQFGPEIVGNSWTTFSFLVKIVPSILNMISNFKNVSWFDLSMAFYDIITKQSFEDVFVTILKLLNKLNCTQVYLILLGVSVAQLAQHLKRNMKNDTIKLVAQAFQAGGRNTFSWTSLMRDLSVWKRALFDIFDVFKNTPIYSYICDTHTELKAIHQDIPNWMKQVSDAYVTQGVFKAGSDYKFSLVITEMMKQGLYFQQAIQKAKVSPSANGAFNVVFRLCNEMAKETKAFALTPQARPEPLVIYMTGATGQGKSVLAQTIPFDLFKTLNIPYNPEVDYYRRNETQDHWDGYNHQKVVCFDDMFQSTDPADVKDSMLDFLHLKNELPYPLKMADLTQKANTWFTSPLIIITSNADMEPGAPIKSLGAVRRRRDIYVQVTIRPEFLKGGVADLVKIRDYSIRKYGDFRFVPDIYVFKHYTSGTETQEPEFIGDLDYEQLIDISAKCWKTLHEKRNMLTKYFDINKDDAPVVAPSVVGNSKWQRIKNIAGEMYNKISFKCQNTFERVKNKIKTFSRVSTTVWNYQNYIAIAAASIVIAGIFISLYFNSKKPKVSEGLTSGDNITKRVVIKNTKWMKKNVAEALTSGDNITRNIKLQSKLKPKLLAEGLVDEMGWGIKEKVSNCNAVEVSYQGNRLHGLMLTNTLLMCPAHILKDGMAGPDCTDDNEVLSIIKPGQGIYKFAYKDILLTVNLEADLLFACLPRECPCFPSIIKYFIKEEDLSKINFKKLVMFGVAKVGNNIETYNMTLLDGKLSGSIQYVANYNDSKSVVMNVVRSIRYTAQTRNGDCGSVLMHLDESLHRKLFGYHVCAYKDLAYGTLVTQEMIMEAMEVLGVRIARTYDLQMPMAQACIPDGLAVMGGPIEDKLHYIPDKTAIRPSMFQGEYKTPITAPASLTTSGENCALYEGLKTNVHEELPFPKNFVDMAVQDLIQHIMSLPNENEPRLLTDYEVVNGIENDDHMNQIDVTTAPGYPYSYMKVKGQGKLPFLDKQVLEDGSYKYTMGPILKSRYEARLKDIEQGIISETIFMDVLKDERRPIIKVQSNQTRVFNVAPMDLNFCLRKYCGSFISHLMHNHVYGETSIGINPHSKAWQLLLEDMLCVSDKFIAGDYSKYDKTLPWQLVSQIPIIISTFLGGYELELDTLFRSTFCGIYCSKYFSYYKYFGNPSGNAMTTVVNSLVNSLLIRIAYLSIGSGHGIKDLTQFQNHIKLKTFGDDNIMSVSECIPWFTMESLSDAFKQYGIKYGAASKDGAMYQYLDVDNITYLKRSFHYIHGEVFAPLPEEVIYETINWMRKNVDPDVIMVQIIESAKKEWFHYGPKIYLERVKELERLAWSHNLRLLGSSYKDFLQQYREA